MLVALRFFAFVPGGKVCVTLLFFIFLHVRSEYVRPGDHLLQLNAKLLTAGPNRQGEREEATDDGSIRFEGE